MSGEEIPAYRIDVPQAQLDDLARVVSQLSVGTGVAVALRLRTAPSEGL